MKIRVWIVVLGISLGLLLRWWFPPSPALAPPRLPEPSKDVGSTP